MSARSQDLVHHLEAEEKVRKTEAQQLRDGIAEAGRALQPPRSELSGAASVSGYSSIRHSI